MAQRFRWTRRGYEADLEKGEVRLLRGLVKDVVALLEARADEAGGHAARPTGPQEGRDPSDPFWSLVAGLGPVAEPGEGDVVEPVRAAPQDPALARLLPDAVPDAPEQERGRQRALTEDALVAAKLADARRALAALQSTRVTVPHEHAAGFGRALNDVRLVLAARLGVEDDEDAARVHAVDDWRDADDVETTMALLYNFTTWLLETLMEEMLAGLPEDPADGTGQDGRGDAGHDAEGGRA